MKPLALIQKEARLNDEGPGTPTPQGLSASIERHLRDYFDAHESGLPASGLYERILHEIERPLLRIALAECDGNQLRAAELLGLNRNTLRKKLRDLGLEAGRSRRYRKGVANDSLS